MRFQVGHILDTSGREVIKYDDRPTALQEYLSEMRSMNPAPPVISALVMHPP